MLSSRRAWWTALVVFAGIGAATLCGAAVAAADTGGGPGGGDRSTSAPSTPSSSSPAKAATGKHRAAAVGSGLRTPKAGQATQPATVDDIVSRATGKSAPKTDVTAHVAALRSLAAPIAHAPPTPGSVTKVVVNLLAHLTVPGAATTPAPAAVGGTARPAAPTPAPETALDAPAANGVTGVKVGHSTLTIPVGSGFNAPADWYFPTQADGSVQANGVIWLQHGFLADKVFYSALATTLAQQTNSIVVAPTLPSFPQLTCRGCTLYGVSMQKAAATMFLGDRSQLNISANQAGYQGTLPEDFTLAGHSAGGGWSVSVGGYYIDALQPGDTNHLLGVVMYDGVNMNGTLPQAIASLDTRDIPVYQIAAPAQMWNTFGTTTDQLLALRPNQFDGVVLVNGSHVDSMLGGNPLVDFFAQLVTQRSPAGNTAATYTLSTGWINDFYAGAGPSAPQFGLYGTAGQPIIMGNAAAVVLPTPLASQLGPLQQLMKKWTAIVLPLLFGGSPATTGVSSPAAPGPAALAA